MNDKHRLTWMRGGVYNLTIHTYVYGTHMGYHIFSTTNYYEEDPNLRQNWYDNDIEHGYYNMSEHPEWVNDWSELP